jgi:hypothetical protein
VHANRHLIAVDFKYTHIVPRCVFFKNSVKNRHGSTTLMNDTVFYIIFLRVRKKIRKLLDLASDAGKKFHHLQE